VLIRHTFLCQYPFMAAKGKVYCWKQLTVKNLVTSSVSKCKSNLTLCAMALFYLLVSTSWGTMQSVGENGKEFKQICNAYICIPFHLHCANIIYHLPYSCKGASSFYCLNIQIKKWHVVMHVQCAVFLTHNKLNL
jgi:hypothetical protein